MYKTIVYCESGEFPIESEDKLNIFTLKGMIYLQEDKRDIFVINKNGLIAIELNKEIIKNK